MSTSTKFYIEVTEICSECKSEHITDSVYFNDKKEIIDHIEDWVDFETIEAVKVYDKQSEKKIKTLYDEDDFINYKNEL